MFKCREIWSTGNRWNRALLTWQKNKQNFAWLSSCSYCADRAQNLSGPAHNNVRRVLQISSKLVHFRRSYSWTRNTAKTRRKVNPIFGWSLSSSRITSLGMPCYACDIVRLPFRHTLCRVRGRNDIHCRLDILEHPYNFNTWKCQSEIIQPLDATRTFRTTLNTPIYRYEQVRRWRLIMANCQ